MFKVCAHVYGDEDRFKRFESLILKNLAPGIAKQTNPTIPRSRYRGSNLKNFGAFPRKEDRPKVSLMKNALIFIAGVIVGVVCLYAWQGYQFQRINMSAPLSQISMGDPSERQSFDVSYGKPLRVEVIGSEEAFTLTLTPLTNGNIGYAWSSVTNVGSSGDGELFEKYEEITKTPMGSHVKDAGSSLAINLDGLTLEWSLGTEKSGFIYYDPRVVTLSYQK